MPIDEQTGHRLIEFFCMVGCNMSLYVYLMRDGSSLRRAMARLQTARPSTARMSVLDWLIAVGLVVAFVAALWFKLVRNTQTDAVL